MANLTARLLGENFEEALGWIENSGEVGIPCEEVTMTYPRAVAEMAAAIRELHRLLATAKADLDRKDRTIIALEELRRQTAYVHSERIKEKEILAYDVGKELEAALASLATAKSEGAAEAYDDIRAQAEDLRKEGGIRASLLRLLAEECVSSAAAIRKGIEAKEGK